MKWRFLLLASLIFSLAQPVWGAEVSGVLLIGSPGVTGCMVCHGDKNLYKVEKGKKRSLFVDKKVLDASPHRDVSCVYCHTDFTYQAVKPQSVDWHLTAGLSCKNCHDEKKKIDHRQNYRDYKGSSHGQKLIVEGNYAAPTCGSCHGGHAIRDLRKPEEKLALKREGYQVCGRCHQDYWDSYDDWYHGRAYKMKASDAPACWDCHGSHDIVPKSKASSRVNDKNLAETCGKCHRGSTKEFTKYGQVVHARQGVLSENWLYQKFKVILKWIGGIF